MENIQTTVTRHGKQRLRERAGIKGSAAPVLAQRAFERGLLMEDIAGRLHEWVERAYYSHDKARELRLYDYRLFIYGRKGALVTAIDLPGELRSSFENALRKKKAGQGRCEQPQIVEQSEITNNGKEGDPVNELINFTGGDEQYPVDCRRLHEQLGVGTKYEDWFPRQTKDVFIEGTDFFSKMRISADKGIGRQPTDHYCTIGMAKEIAMLQRNEKGREVRRYLIKVEEDWNSPDAVIARALRMADAKLAAITGKALRLEADNSRLMVENHIMAPKAEYFDALVDHNALTGIRETAKELHVKERDFVGFLLDHKYIYRDQKGKLMPYAQHVTAGLFELKECVNEKTGWGGTQTLITPKGRDTFMRLIQGISA